MYEVAMIFRKEQKIPFVADIEIISLVAYKFDVVKESSTFVNWSTFDKLL